MISRLAALAALLTAFACPAASPSWINPNLNRQNVTSIVSSFIGSSTNAAGDAFTNLLWASTIFVDATNGNDTTFRIGDMSKPARSAAVALEAVQSGQSVWFRPGYYPVEIFGGAPTNGIAIYAKSNLWIGGDNAVLYGDGRGTMIAMGFVTNVTFEGLTLLGYRGESLGAVNEQSAAVWIEGDSEDVTFRNVKVLNWINQGICTYRHPDHGWGYRRINVVDSYFAWVGFTNFSMAQPNDGTAVVICGNDIIVSRNTFEYCLRDFETFTHTDNLPDQVWRNYRITENLSVGAMEEFLAQGATNVQDWVISDNAIWMFTTNRQVVSANQKGMNFFGGMNILIQNNLFHGCAYGIQFKTDTPGDLDRFYVRNNSFVAIGDNAIHFFLRPNGTVPPKRVHIDGNSFFQVGGYGVVAGFNDGSISGNTFVDVGTNGIANRVIHFADFFMADGGTLDLNPCTNTVISGNYIANSVPGSGVTDGTILIGDRAYNTRVDRNQLVGVNPIGNANSTTVGIIGLGWNDYIGGAGLTKPWTCTNASTGEGTWGSVLGLTGLNFAAGEKEYSLLAGGQGGDGLVISNTAGIAVEFFDNKTRFSGDITLPSATVTGIVVRVPGTVTGTGGANTNFTLLASQGTRVINGFTNVSIRAVMQTDPALVHEWSLLITNGSGTTRTLEFSAVTNRWRFAGIYGTNAPNTLTNGTQLLIRGRSAGTNTLIEYSYFPWP